MLTDQMRGQINVIWFAVKECKVIKLSDDRKMNVDSIYRWIKAFPSINIINEIRKADMWLYERNKHKRNYYRFIGNWLRRASGQVSFLRTGWGQAVPMVRFEPQSGVGCENDQRGSGYSQAELQF